MSETADQRSSQLALRDLPSVDHLLNQPAIGNLLDEYPRGELVGAVREALEACRQAILSGRPHSADLRDMALAILDVSAHQRENRKMPPEFDTIRAVAAGDEEGAFLHIEVTGGPAPASYIVDRRGMLTRSRTTPKGNESVTKQLTSADVMKLKRALMESRMWCWRAVRTEPLAGEGESRFRVVSGAPGGANVDVTLREREAREVNPFSRKLMAALGSVCNKMEPRKN